MQKSDSRQHLPGQVLDCSFHEALPRYHQLAHQNIQKAAAAKLRDKHYPMFVHKVVHERDDVCVLAVEMSLDLTLRAKEPLCLIQLELCQVNKLGCIAVVSVTMATSPNCREGSLANRICAFKLVLVVESEWSRCQQFQ